MTEAMIKALAFLNANFDPWTFKGDEPVAVDLARLLESSAPVPQWWQDISTAPKDQTLIIGALIRDGRVWRVHEMRHNGLAFYTCAGGSLPQMTHWMPLPDPPSVSSVLQRKEKKDDDTPREGLRDAR